MITRDEAFLVCVAVAILLAIILLEEVRDAWFPKWARTAVYSIVTVAMVVMTLCVILNYVVPKF